MGLVPFGHGEPDRLYPQTALDLDEAAAMEAQRRAQQALSDRSAEIDYAKALAEYAEAAAQLQAIQRLRQRSGRS